MFTGNCLCEKVRFEFEPTPTDVSVCHCSICRKTTGTAFGTYIKLAATDYKLTEGADALRSYDVTENLSIHFCRACGTTVHATHAEYPGFIYVSLGAMSEDSGIRPTYHEFVGSKASWYEIHDSLPQFEEWSKR